MGKNHILTALSLGNVRITFLTRCLMISGSSFTYSQSTLRWIAQPGNQTVEKGSPVSFRCSASFDNKRLEYHWQKDREDITPDKSSPFSIEKADGTLKITNTQLDDRGEYHCLVKKRGKKKILGESSSAFLSVTGKRKTPP